ncbi:MAG: undecaprenyl-diphosphate phosphatase [Endomicrobium sp.]|jgi:undecaprenyl-diphosphatase|nr:undecaprenyl-diphosphate phosphatase [Endomicrobium sp.]
MLLITPYCLQGNAGDKENTMFFDNIIKAGILGVVEGITEWLPISSTGHMILVDEFIKLNVSPAFREMFLVVIQLGAILSVIVMYWRILLPVDFGENKPFVIKKDVVNMWFKIIISCLPAAVIGLIWDDKFNELFYNYQTVAVMLIVVGIIFIAVEQYQKDKKPKFTSIAQITYQAAVIIGLCQVVAAIFPGTSRSGATIIGALLLGVSRTAAAQYTFFLAIPVMFGASALKLFKFGLHFSPSEISIIIVGMATAFVISTAAINFLLSYITKHDFKVFGWYRIAVGCAVLLRLVL